MRTRSWPHILLNNGPGEVLLHTNRRWIGRCADLKLKSSRDSSYFMVLCQVCRICRCFHGFSVFPVSSVFPVFSTRRYRSNKHGTSSSFFWPVPSAPSWQRSNNVRRWSTRPWHLMGTFWGHLFWAVWNNNSFHPFGLFPILFEHVAFVDSSRPKQEKLQTVRWHLPWRRKSLKK